MIKQLKFYMVCALKWRCLNEGYIDVISNKILAFAI